MAKGIHRNTGGIPQASCEVFQPFATLSRRKQSTTHKVHVVVVSGRWPGEEEEVEEEEEEEEDEEGVGVFMLLIDRYSR